MTDPQTTTAKAIHDATEELLTATFRFGAFNSAHEGFAVLAEEVDELWDEVRGKQGARSRERLYREATQVAAMALRFMIDCASTDVQANR